MADTLGGTAFQIAAGSLEATLKGVGVAFEIGSMSLKTAADEIKDQLKKFNDLQEQSLDIGLSYNQTLDKTRGSLDKFSTTLDTRFSVGLGLLKNRIDVNTEGLIKLASVQEALGISSKETLSTFKQTQIVGNLTNKQLGDLGQTLLESSLTFQTSTEVLVNALNELAPALEDAALANGDVAGIAEASMLAIGAAGEGYSKQMASIINFLVDPSLDAMSKKAILGITDSTDKLLYTNLTSEQKAKEILDLIARASGNLESAFGKGKFTKTILESLGDRQLFTSIIQLSKGLKDLNISVDQKIAEQKAKNALNNLMEGIESAFDRVSMEFGRRIEPLTAPILEVITAIADGVVSAIGPAIDIITNTFGKMFGEGTNFLEGVKKLSKDLTIGFVQLVLSFAELVYVGTNIIIEILPTITSLIRKIPEMLVGILESPIVSTIFGLSGLGIDEEVQKLKSAVAKSKDEKSLEVFSTIQKELEKLKTISIDQLKAMMKTTEATESIDNKTKDPEKDNILIKTNNLMDETFREYFKLQRELSSGKTLKELAEEQKISNRLNERMIDQGDKANQTALAQYSFFSNISPEVKWETV